MLNPKVSFVVPCYKLAHLLPECVNSILTQTFGSFEILIMDDCSPDNTPEVAKSFKDPRVRHIRNEPNLRHLRNYNKGIELSRGEYIWLISADDYLRKSYVLEKYVKVLENNPRIGYAFCSGVGVRKGLETEVLSYSVYAKHDCVVSGHQLLKRLAFSNIVLAASGLVRRECYERLGAFPLDMPYAGDWYLWCLFALHYDVAFFAEPMVAYREHELSMTNKLFKEDVAGCCEEDVRVPWAIKRKAQEAGFVRLSKVFLNGLGQIYARSIATKRYGMANPSLTLKQFEESLCRNTQNETEREFVRSRVYAGIGNEYYWQKEVHLAMEFYSSALGKDFWLPKVHLKRVLLGLGKSGDFVRRVIFSFR
jgi:glycosyltransferase involved in cell wall biosynthesis